MIIMSIFVSRTERRERERNEFIGDRRVRSSVRPYDRTKNCLHDNERTRTNANEQSEWRKINLESIRRKDLIGSIRRRDEEKYIHGNLASILFHSKWNENRRSVTKEKNCQQDNARKIENNRREERQTKKFSLILFCSFLWHVRWPQMVQRWTLSLSSLSLSHIHTFHLSADAIGSNFKHLNISLIKYKRSALQQKGKRRGGRLKNAILFKWEWICRTSERTPTALFRWGKFHFHASANKCIRFIFALNMSSFSFFSWWWWWMCK